jgi:preprotein translocase subunit YajC
VEDLAGFLPLILIVALFWFLILRPAQKRSRDARATQQAAQVGAQVMLTSGIFGKVVDALDDTLWVEVAPGTTLRVVRGAIAQVIPDSTPSAVDGPTDAGEPGDDSH